MLSSKKAKLKKVLIIIIALVLIFTAVSMAATKFIYDGVFVRYDKPIAIPQEVGPIVDSRQKISYNSGDNLLSGYLYVCDQPNKKDGLVVLAPGFRAGADSYLCQIDSLLKFGWSVFAFDPTGSYGSEGDSCVGFSQELLDLEATLDHIEKKGRYGFEHLAILGHSRGGYAACCALRSKHDISAVVSVSGINSAMDGIIEPSVDKAGALAYGNYGFLWLYQAVLFGTDTVNVKACEEINKSNTPVLIVHGSNDSQVSRDKHSVIAHKDCITAPDTEYYICSESGQNGHTSLLFDGKEGANEQLMKKINEFLESKMN